jgi:PAS domain S-box-containing protein
VTDDIAALLLAESPDALILTTGDGNIVHWGVGARAMLGYSSDEVLGRNLDELVVPLDHLEEAGRILRGVIRSRATRRLPASRARAGARATAGRATRSRSRWPR